jgi:hypothetical protein
MRLRKGQRLRCQGGLLQSLAERLRRLGCLLGHVCSGTLAEWWRQLQADADAMDRAIEREHHAAVDVGQLWPPSRQPQPEPGPESAMQLEESRPRPGIPEPEPDGNDERAARLDELQTRAAAAAARVAADNAERDARAEYAARIERQALAEAEAAPQAETLPDAELEL